jgi:hypothetical protein
MGQLVPLLRGHLAPADGQGDQGREDRDPDVPVRGGALHVGIKLTHSP